MLGTNKHHRFSQKNFPPGLLHGSGITQKGFQQQSDICVIMTHLASRSTSLGLLHPGPTIDHVNVILAYPHLESLGVGGPSESPKNLVRLSEVLRGFHLGREEVPAGNEKLLQNFQ